MDSEIKNSLDHYRWEGNLLKIYTYTILKEMTFLVEVFDQGLERPCFDMLFTMYHVRGIGLAAPGRSSSSMWCTAPKVLTPTS